MNGGELITGLLRDHGIATVFAVAGASHTRLLDPLEKHGFRIISSRHESGAVGGADGYARVRSDPARAGVALIVAEQGLPNAVPALSVAWHANSPVVLIAATVPRGFAEAETAIDQNQLELVTPITKWARTVPSVDRLADYVTTAIKQATSGRPGPVALLVPTDLLSASAPPRRVSAAAAVSPALPCPHAVERAVDLIERSNRPIIVSGAGARRGSAGTALTGLVSEFGIPILGNGLGRGLVAEDWDCSFSWPFAQIAAGLADCVIVVGARLTQRLGHGLPPRLGREASIIQIDIDPGAFHRNRAVDVSLHASAGPGAQAILDGLRRRRAEPKSRAWLHDALAARMARAAELRETAGPCIHPLRLGAEIARRLPADTVIVGDGADIQNWMYGAIAVRRPGGFMDHYPMGAMGSGTPLAVGAAAALRELADASGEEAPPTLLVTGDGSLGFYPAELHAAARAGLRLLVIVGNDGAWGTEAHGQWLTIGRTINTELGTLPYARLAEAFGCKGMTCDDTSDLRQAIETLLASQEPALLDVRIDPDAGLELKQNPTINMILFNDINEGHNELAGKP